MSGLLIAISALGCAAAPAAAENRDEAAQALQQSAFDLASAGEWKRALAELEELHRKFGDLPRGTAAYHHAGNLLETQRMTEAETPEQAREILGQAREYFEKSAAAAAEKNAGVAERSRASAARLADSLAALGRVAEGKIAFREGSEILSDLEASRAAVVYLKRQRAANAAAGDLIAFLMLVHQNDYEDGMTHRLSEIKTRIEKERPDLYPAAFAQYSERLDAAARDGVALAEEAIAQHPASAHFLDYQVYLGEARRYAALGAMARRERATELGESAKAEKLKAEILGHLKAARAANTAILEFAATALKPTEADAKAAPADPRYDAETLGKHQRAARERIAEFSAMIIAFENEGKTESGAGPQAADAAGEAASNFLRNAGARK